MSRYVPIRSFAGDWKNDSHGRRVKCSRCNASFLAFVRLTDAVCGCGSQMMVLTERSPTAKTNISRHGNTPQRPRVGRDEQEPAYTPNPYRSDALRRPEATA